MRNWFPLLAALPLMALAHAAAAQSSGASSTGTTGANSTSTNSVFVNAYTGSGNAGSGSTGSGAATTNVNYSGHEWSTPSVQGSYFAGANPCLVGVGASGAGGPIGLSFTFGRSDEGCQRRSDAAAWHALGHDDVAIARMCQDVDNRTAFESLGMLCPQDRPKLAPIAALRAAAPQAIASARPVTQAPPAPQRPDWCDTVTGDAERLYYKKVCAF